MDLRVHREEEEEEVIMFFMMMFLLRTFCEEKFPLESICSRFASCKRGDFVARVGRSFREMFLLRVMSGFVAIFWVRGPDLLRLFGGRSEEQV